MTLTMCFVLHANGFRIQLVAIVTVKMTAGRPTARMAPTTQAPTSSLFVSKLRVFTFELLSQTVEEGLTQT
jgi:hypothetical protein